MATVTLPLEEILRRLYVHIRVLAGNYGILNMATLRGLMRSLKVLQSHLKVSRDGAGEAISKAQPQPWADWEENV